MEAPKQHQTNPLLLNEDQALQVLTQFLRSEVRRVGVERVVLGLSGGVDSALSTYLAARALGPEQVHVVLMPYKISNPQSLSDAMAVVDDLNLSHEIVEITPMADPFFDHTEGIDKMRKGNVLARMRMIVLYDRSQAQRALVVGTSNKTESLLGYTTLFGDNASAVNPLGDLYKTQVWQLSKAIGVPQQIIAKAPSADLWQGQTDESELGITYREADELLFYMIDLRESDAELIQRGFAPERVTSIRSRVQRMQFKRRPPVIAKISGRTINTDFRYPRDWGT